MGAWSSQFGRQRHPRNNGKFRSLLALVPSTGAQGDGGDYQPSWGSSPVSSMEVHGHWRQTSQREAVMDGGKYTGASGVWEIPWVPDLTTEYRVGYGSRLYRIVGIENLEERNRELHLFCVEDEGARGVTG